jgi:curved DNA-binding protein CbpA
MRASTPPTPHVIGPTELGPSGIAARAKKVGTEDYFAILGVDRNATTEAIRAAYFRLAKVWHPDRLPMGLLPFREEVATIFAHMTRAQQTLCDPEAKRQWMDGHNIGLRKRPREEIIRAIDDALSKGEWSEAERESRRLAESDPNDAEALALLAWAAARGGDAPDDTLRMSLVSLDRAVHLDRSSERSLFLRGCLAKKLGKVDAAFRDFARVVHLNPHNVDAAREVRLFEMRSRKGSGEHPLGGVFDLLKGGKKDS